MKTVAAEMRELAESVHRLAAEKAEKFVNDHILPRIHHEASLGKFGISILIKELGNHPVSNILFVLGNKGFSVKVIEPKDQRDPSALHIEWHDQ